MQRYFLEIAYEGTAYHGWQLQPNAISVQAVVEKALATLLRQRVRCVGCGRTDSGVHATQFFLHFDVQDPIEDKQHFVFKLNNVLPKDIAAYELLPVAPKSHARFDASERAYSYHIHQRKDPFLQGRSTYCIHHLDLAAMQAACDKLLAVKDFASFCKAGADVKTTLCDLKEARWEKQGHRLIFHIRADRFLRNMVRAIVGTLMDVGKGRISVEEFEEIVARKDRSAAGTSVAAHGLYLSEVNYPFL